MPRRGRGGRVADRLEVGSGQLAVTRPATAPARSGTPIERDVLALEQQLVDEHGEAEEVAEKGGTGPGAQPVSSSSSTGVTKRRVRARTQH